MMTKTGDDTDAKDASAQIDQLIAGLHDWRGPKLARVRQIFHDADAEMVEEWKWMGSPTWSRDGLIAFADPHKTKVKVTFAQGAQLADSHSLFNGQDNGKTRRSIDIFEGDALNEKALKALIEAAIAYNLAHLKKNRPASKKANA